VSTSPSSPPPAVAYPGRSEHASGPGLSPPRNQHPPFQYPRSPCQLSEIGSCSHGDWRLFPPRPTARRPAADRTITSCVAQALGALQTPHPERWHILPLPLPPGAVKVQGGLADEVEPEHPGRPGVLSSFSLPPRPLLAPGSAPRCPLPPLLCSSSRWYSEGCILLTSPSAQWVIEVWSFLVMHQSSHMTSSTLLGHDAGRP
jgi:hypothetical protein